MRTYYVSKCCGLYRDRSNRGSHAILGDAMAGGCRARGFGSGLSESARRNEHSTLRRCCAGGSGSGLAELARRNETDDRPTFKSCCAGGSGSGRAGLA